MALSRRGFLRDLALAAGLAFATSAGLPLRSRRPEPEPTITHQDLSGFKPGEWIYVEGTDGHDGLYLVTGVRTDSNGHSALDLRSTPRSV